MKQTVTETVINLIAVIVAVTDDTPRLLIVDQGEASTPGHTPLALPNGPFEPATQPSLESSLRRWVEAQTGLDLYYVEQLYTFGNRFRDPGEFRGDMDTMLCRLRESPPAEGCERVYFAGQKELEKEAECRESGVPVLGHTYDELREVAAEEGLEPPRAMD